MLLPASRNQLREDREILPAWAKKAALLQQVRRFGWQVNFG
jgi:hypothetical protein